MGLIYLTGFDKLVLMRRVLSKVLGKRRKKRRTWGEDMEWMKDQIVQMRRMNQEVVSMAIGRE